MLLISSGNGCAPSQKQAPAEPETPAPMNPAPSNPAPTESPEDSAWAAGETAPELVEEPSPESAEVAVLVVRQYYQAVQQGNFESAYAKWGESAAALMLRKVTVKDGVLLAELGLPTHE